MRSPPELPLLRPPLDCSEPAEQCTPVAPTQPDRTREQLTRLIVGWLLAAKLSGEDLDAIHRVASPTSPRLTAIDHIAPELRPRSPP